jgi:hypothetical protein
MPVKLLSVIGFELWFLPIAVLAWMNDDKYVKEHTSGPIGNAFLAVLTLLGALLAIVIIPLELLGG